MKKISGSTFFIKKIYPILLFGFLGLFLVAPYLPGGKEPFPGFVVLPALMAVIPFMYYRKYVWNLVDFVYDNQNELIFRKGKKEQRVQLCDVEKISFSRLISFGRIQVHVKTKGDLGELLEFLPSSGFSIMNGPPMIQEIIERVDCAKRK